MNLLLTFIILNIFNVIIQTVKSLCTVKCTKGVAALVNAIAYGFYTIVTIYMLCDLSLWVKAGVVALCNLIGVYVVKWAEEKARKDKLWKVEMTVRDYHTDKLSTTLKKLDIPFNYIENVGKHTVFNVYCATQKQSMMVKNIGEECKAKFFVSETKNL
jgi:uncharacterized protein YebE (UPF0316 family)